MAQRQGVAGVADAIPVGCDEPVFCLTRKIPTVEFPQIGVWHSCNRQIVRNILPKKVGPVIAWQLLIERTGEAQAFFDEMFVGIDERRLLDPFRNLMV